MRIKKTHSWIDAPTDIKSSQHNIPQTQSKITTSAKQLCKQLRKHNTSNTSLKQNRIMQRNIGTTTCHGLTSPGCNNTCKWTGGPGHPIGTLPELSCFMGWSPCCLGDLGLRLGLAAWNFDVCFFVPQENRTTPDDRGRRKHKLHTTDADRLEKRTTHDLPPPSHT